MEKKTKRSFTHYYIQSKEGIEAPSIVGHSSDEETGEVYYKFLDRAKAKKLLSDEKKSIPTKQYRLVKLTQTYETTDWE